MFVQMVQRDGSFAAAASPHFIKYKKENEKYEIQDRKRKEKTRDRSRFRTFDHS
jgi:hypothetical protein